MENFECSATCTCAHATDVENILDGNTCTVEGQRSRRVVEVES